MDHISDKIKYRFIYKVGFEGAIQIHTYFNRSGRITRTSINGRSVSRDFRSVAHVNLDYGSNNVLAITSDVYGFIQEEVKYRCSSVASIDPELILEDQLIA